MVGFRRPAGLAQGELVAPGWAYSNRRIINFLINHVLMCDSTKKMSKTVGNPSSMVFM